MISSGAVLGQLSCELWFSLCLPYSVSQARVQHVFVSRDFLVLYARPRILVVQVDAPHLQARFISAHAPTSQNPLDRASFFLELEPWTQTSGPLFLFIDANARLDLLSKPHDASIKKRDYDAAQQFHTYLSSNHLFATVQLEQFNVSAAGTHVNNNSPDRAFTLDYIVSKSDFQQHVRQSSVQQHIDNGHAVDDHYLVDALFAWQLTRDGNVRASQAPPRLSRNQLSDVSAIQSLGEKLARIPNPAWSTNLDEHHEYVTSAIAQAISSTFKAPKVKIKKPYASQRLVDLISERRTLKLHLRLIKRVLLLPEYSCPTDEVTVAVSAFRLSLTNMLLQLRKSVKHQAKYDYSMYVLHIGTTLTPLALAQQEQCRPIRSEQNAEVATAYIAA